MRIELKQISFQKCDLNPSRKCSGNHCLKGECTTAVDSIHQIVSDKLDISILDDSSLQINHTDIKKRCPIYIRRREGKIVTSDEVVPNIIIDFDSNGEVLGIEIL